MAYSANSGLQGVNVAAITPRGKTGDLNFGATFDILDYLGAARVGGIALFTAAGEYPALALDDRARLLYLAVKRSRVPVVAGVGSATLDDSLTLAREARSAGATAILLPPPLFYHYDQDDIREFYAQFAAQLGGGVAIYLSGEIEPETACGLLDSGRFAGIEDSSGDAALLEHWRASPAAVLCGHDSLFVGARCNGLGVISPAAGVAPELAMALDRAIASGDTAAIGRLDVMFCELSGWLQKFPAAVALKTAVAVRGIPTGPLAIPLSAGKQRCLEQFREWFKAWLPATRKLTAHG